MDYCRIAALHNKTLSKLKLLTKSTQPTLRKCQKNYIISVYISSKESLPLTNSISHCRLCQTAILLHHLPLSVSTVFTLYSYGNIRAKVNVLSWYNQHKASKTTMKDVVALCILARISILKPRLPFHISRLIHTYVLSQQHFPHCLCHLRNNAERGLLFPTKHIFILYYQHHAHIFRRRIFCVCRKD